MSRLFIFILTLFSALFLCGCHFIKKPAFLDTRNKEYLAAKTIPPLRIPPGVSSSAFYDQYPIPYRQYPPEVLCVNTRPPGL